VPARPSRASLIGERPLSPTQRSALVFAAATTVLVFYVAAIVFMATTAAILALLFIVAVAGARFGLAWLMGRVLRTPAQLLGIFARRLWLPTPTTYRLELQAADAPALFDLARGVAERSNVRPPARIFIEMHSNAWVHLKGFWRASGRTELGIGFDLLAALNVAEVESVVAHELAHARLVQRGFSRWLGKGLTRLAYLSGELNVLAASLKAAKSPSHLANLTARLFDSLTRRAARLVATYSRQDEFEADCGAAEVCGVAVARAALERLREVDTVASQLPWSERWARLQPGENFTEWLVGELSHRDANAHDLGRQAVDPYSTHPSMRDRLAVLSTLPAGVGTPRDDTRPGVALLASPNTVAERLAAEIQRVVVLEEGRDSKTLAKQTRKLSRPVQTKGITFFGGTLIAIAVIVAGFGLFEPITIEGVVSTIALVVAGGLALRAGRHRDRRWLPVPAYGTLTNTQLFASNEQLAAAEKALVEELRALGALQKKKRARFDALLDQGYAALKESSYLRAHVACRLALEVRKRAPEAQLGYAVAAAGLGNASQAQQMLEAIRQREGLRTFSQKWGAAWAMTLLGDWSCEGFLQQVCDQRPDVATFAACLSFAQYNRGKLLSAARNAERAEKLDPSNRAIRGYLVHLLLAAGRVSDAERHLAPLDDIARTDVGVAFDRVRVALMKRDVDAAREWAAVLRGLDTDGGALISLGQAFTMSRLPDPAAEYYTAAAAARFSPEAQLGLATLAQFRGDRDGARRHLLAALNFEGARWSPGQNVNALFHEVLARLNALGDERLTCRAWIATFPAGEIALGGLSLIVCAPTEDAAREHLTTIVVAMQPASAYDMSAVAWKEAPEEQQPIRPMPPGVQSVLA
jgi:Zn-dependent protease with chaperone function/tetratricopeptide (TPR) repeat protein